MENDMSSYCKWKFLFQKFYIIFEWGDRITKVHIWIKVGQ